jgi:hypothetical protein
LSQTLPETQSVLVAHLGLQVPEASQRYGEQSVVVRPSAAVTV